MFPDSDMVHLLGVGIGIGIPIEQSK